MKICIVQVRSESGDTYGPFLFNKKPNDEQLKQLLIDRCNLLDETVMDDEMGPGIFGSYLHVDFTMAEIQQLD